MATAPTAATFLATGNNLIFEADITSRVVPCDLDPEVERPEEREFDVNLYEHVPAHRGELVAAALTILRAYHVAGRPSVGIPRWGGFEEWSDWIRSALVWLGQADPAEGKSRVEELDPVRRQLRSLLTAWSEAFDGRTLTLAEAVKEANYPVNENLKNALLDVAGVRGEIDWRRLSRFVASHENRIELGLRFIRTGVSHQAIIWGVISPKSNKTTPQTPQSKNMGESGESGESVLPQHEKVSVGDLFSPTDTGGYPSRNDSPHSPDSPALEFTCPDCKGHLFRLARSGKQVCAACWPLG
jgi:hypothetical protein